MKLTGKTCYSHLLHLLHCGPLLEQATKGITIKHVDFAHEGLAGYIEAQYEIEVKDLEVFARVWSSWYSLSNTARLQLYGMAKGLN